MKTVTLISTKQFQSKKKKRVPQYATIKKHGKPTANINT